MPDVILSSGYLGFSRHLGFIDAIEAADIEIDAIVGTSSGALIGALVAAGMRPDAIIAALPARPIDLVRPGLPWRGLLSSAPLLSLLRELLPPRFSDLRRPFAAGVADARTHRAALLTEGDLPAAVAASCAIPWMFEPVAVDGAAWCDGGVADRTAVTGWRRWRPARAAVLHRITRTRGREGEDDLTRVLVVESKRANAGFFSLGPFEAERAETRARAHDALEAAELSA